MACGECNKSTGIVGAVKGAIGLAKAEAGIGIADEQTTMQRRGLCEACFEWAHGRCKVCKCYTWAKTRISVERCPLGKWGAAT